MKRTKLLLRFVVVVLGVALVSAGVWKGLFKPKEPHLENGDFGAVADFQLTDQAGRTVSLADLKGQVWVADFIFTRCGGPCPRLTRTMARLQASVPPERPVRFVSFTVDPDHDKPAVLADYGARFGADPARWRFLTGETAAVRGLIMDSFKLAVQENTGPNRRAGEEVTHSLHFVVVDKDGRIRGYFTATDDDALDRLRRRLESLA